jgi:hypothetical protein
MTMRKRSIVVAAIACLFLILYAAARMNSPLLLEYVVERTLIQKSPPGSDPEELSRRFHSLLDSSTDRQERTNLLFRISRELEKLQVLSPRALDDLLRPGNDAVGAI